MADKPATVRDVQRLATRAHIVGAARRVFEERGYRATTIDDIINGAGASRATFYSHFESKSQLALEVGRLAMTEVEALYHQLDEVLADGSREGFRQWLARAIDWMRARSRLVPMSQQAASDEPEFRALRREFLETIPTWMPRFIQRWPVEERSGAALRVKLLVVLLLGYGQRVPHEEVSDLERDQVVDELASVWFLPLSPEWRGWLEHA